MISTTLVSLSERHAHMPFVFRKRRQLQMVYSQSTRQYRRRGRRTVAARPTAWKLHWLEAPDAQAQQIPTGLDKRDDECSPTLVDSKGQVHLSFIGTLRHERPSGATLDGGTHRLFTMRGPAIDQLQPATRYSDEECFCGFARPDLAILASGVDGTARIVGSRWKSLRTTFTQLVRISYASDTPSRILITGAPGPGQAPETIVVDFDSGQVLGALRVNDQPCYKPSLLTDLAVVPQSPFGTAGWRLLSSDKYVLAPTPIQVTFA